MIKIRIYMLGSILKIDNEDFGTKGFTTNSLLSINNAVKKVQNDEIELAPIVTKILDEYYCINSIKIKEALEQNIQYIDIEPTSKYDDFLIKYPVWKKHGYSSYLANKRNIMHNEIRFPYQYETREIGTTGFTVFKFKIDEKEKYLKEKGNRSSVSKLLEYIKPEYELESWYIHHKVPNGSYIVFNIDELEMENYNSFYKTKKEAQKNLVGKNTKILKV